MTDDGPKRALLVATLSRNRGRSAPGKPGRRLGVFRA